MTIAQASQVCISVLNWNGAAMTIRCLESLMKLDYPRFEIVVVDNASRDDSVQQIQTAFPDIMLIRAPENLGFAGGHRLALEHAQQANAELLWVLNNDTVVRPDTLNALVQAYRGLGEALYGSVAVDASDKALIQITAWAVDPAGKPKFLQEEVTPWGMPYHDWFTGPQVLRVANVSGSSFLIPLVVVTKHGFMDETYFLYAEETDYCFRLLQRGVPSFIVPTSVVIHELRGTSKRQPGLQALLQYYKVRNHLLLVRKYRGFRVYAIRAWQMVRQKRFLRRRLKAWLTLRRFSDLYPDDYYWYLGIWHSLLNRTGKTFAPEDFWD